MIKRQRFSKEVRKIAGQFKTAKWKRKTPGITAIPTAEEAKAAGFQSLRGVPVKERKPMSAEEYKKAKGNLITSVLEPYETRVVLRDIKFFNKPSKLLYFRARKKGASHEEAVTRLGGRATYDHYLTGREMKEELNNIAKENPKTNVLGEFQNLSKKFNTRDAFTEISVLNTPKNHSDEFIREYKKRRKQGLSPIEAAEDTAMCLNGELHLGREGSKTYNDLRKKGFNPTDAIDQVNVMSQIDDKYMSSSKEHKKLKKIQRKAKGDIYYK